MTPQTAEPDVRVTLERCPLLEPLGEGQIEALAHRCRVVTLKEGETLFSADDAAQNLFVVARGRVEVRLTTPSGRVLDVVEAGLYTLNGWLSLVDSNLYVAEARAIRDSTVLVCTTEDMEAVLLGEPEAAYQVMKKIASLISLRLRRMKEGFAEVLEDQMSWE